RGPGHGWLSSVHRRRALLAPGRAAAASLHDRVAADLCTARSGHRRARSVGIPAPVPGRAPGRGDPLLRGPALAGRAGHVPAAGAAARPSPAHEHLPRQVAALPGGAGPRRGHAVPARGRTRGGVGPIPTAKKKPAEAGFFDHGVPTGIRTPVATVKGLCPRPLDDGDRNIGGARRDRTADLLHAMQALSQLSYGPTAGKREIL